MSIYACAGVVWYLLARGILHTYIYTNPMNHRIRYLIFNERAGWLGDSVISEMKQ